MGNACAGPQSVQEPDALQALEDELANDLKADAKIRLDRPTDPSELKEYKREVAAAKKELEKMKDSVDQKIVETVTAEGYREIFKKAFEKYDKNKNGMLEPKELSGLVHFLVEDEKNVRRFFRSKKILSNFIVYFDAIDDSGEGVLNFDETYDLLTVLASLSFDHYVKEANHLRAELNKTLVNMSPEADHLVRRKAFDDAVHIAFAVACGANDDYLEQDKLVSFLTHFCQELETIGASFNIPTQENADIVFAAYDADFSGNLSYLEARKMCVVLAAQYLNTSITRQLSRKAEASSKSVYSNVHRNSDGGSARSGGSVTAGNRDSFTESAQSNASGGKRVTIVANPALSSEEKKKLKDPKVQRAVSQKFNADWRDGSEEEHKKARSKSVPVNHIDMSDVPSTQGAADKLPRKSLTRPVKGSGKFDDW